MKKMASRNGNGRKLATQQSVNSAVKSICDIMRRSNCAGALQYVPELTWILFLRILDERETQLRGTPELQALPAGSVQQVMHLTAEARKTITEARFVPAIRDRISRYTSQDFPTQLSLAAHFAAAHKAAASGKLADAVNEPVAKEPRYLAATSLRVACGLSYIATEADLDKWLAALRATAAKELANGNRISL